MSGIAVVGMACVFPGARDLGAFAENLVAGRDAITDVPASRLDASYFDPGGFPCRRGGFIDEPLAIDPAALGVMPVAAEGAEPDQLLALHVALRAVADAGLDEGALPRDRTCVVLGRGGYLNAGVARVDQHVRVVPQLVECLKALMPNLPPEALSQARDAIRARLPRYAPDTAIGLVPNLAASRIASRLDLHGAAYTIDAACASSLLAVERACEELASGRADLALAGGVHLCHDPTFWSVFTQLGALSRSGRSRPFHRDADGLLIGEGAGILVLAREADARRRGDRVYATIRGCGVSSDGHGASLMQPRREGQALALQRAWAAAAIDPASIGLLEAHGTATPAGDATELATLAGFFGRSLDGRAAIGSVKSMIGHAMPAAGAAGLIKAVLAIHHGVKLPTLHADEPHERLAETGFRALAESETWSEATRVAGVSAFGFGGINAHVVLSGEGAARAPRRAPRRPALLRLAGPDAAALARMLDAGASAAGDGVARLALLDPTPERRARAREILARGRAHRSDRDGIWFTPRGLAADGGRVAFLFPGLDAGFDADVGDVAARFGLDAPARAGESLEARGRATVGASLVLDAALRSLGARPDALAGHSIGEWTGMVAAGLVARAAIEDLLEGDATIEVPGVAFAALGCGVEQARGALEGLDEIAISHDNCPHQVIACGREASIETAVARLRQAGILCEVLPFRSGFHSPAFDPHRGPHRRYVRDLEIAPPGVPLWSATTCAPYPVDAAGVRALAMRHLVEPVRFRETIERMHHAGVRLFVEVGGGRLSSFVEDTLRGRAHVAIRTAAPRRPGLEQLQRAAAQLWVEGATARCEALADEAGGATMTLRLGPALVSMEGVEPLASVSASGLPAPDAGDPVMAALTENLRVLKAAQEDVAQALARRSGPPRPRELREQVEISLETFPQLLDHCFYRQPEGWPHVADRFPVLPLTSAIALMARHARQLAPGKVVVAVERVRALRWIAAAPASVLPLVARCEGDSRVEVGLGDHASATFVLAERFGPAPEAALRLSGGVAAEIDAARLYEDRWMFHGPRFQGVRELGPIAQDGIGGVLEALPAEGALLDNAGQLFGYWIMMRTPTDRLAFPARIDRIELFGEDPAPGTRLACTVRITALEAQRVRADLELVRDGRCWARIAGWEDRRFATSERLFATLRYPEREAHAEAREGGWCAAAEVWSDPASRELIARRYLSGAERAAMDAMGPERRAWLLGRVAGKDAVRRFLWSRGHGPIHPIEIELDDVAAGRPLRARGAGAGLRVAVAATDALGVALVGEGDDHAIAIERVGGDGEAAAAERARSRLPSARGEAAAAIEAGHAVAWRRP